MKSNNITLLILAGGEGTRMDLVGKVTPKVLLPVYDEQLLLRQIRQAKEASLKNILVSTSPASYNFMRSVLEDADYDDIKIFNNTGHLKGSLPALRVALDRVTTPAVLMSFGDIYFLDNPFPSFISGNKNDYMLGVAKPFDKKELSLGGIIFVDNRHVVTGVVEKPILNNKEGLRWNGLALFKTKDKDKLKEFLSKYPSDSPGGNFFEYLRIETNTIFASVQGADFINVNTPENLMVATLYRYSEAENRNRILSIARKIRKYSLLKA